VPPTPAVLVPTAPAVSAPPAHPMLTPATLVVLGVLPSDMKSLGEGGTMVRSHALTADDTTRDGCGGVTGRIANRWVIAVTEVRLLPLTNHFFVFMEVISRSRSHKSNMRLNMHTKKTSTRKTRGEPSWVGAPFPRDSMRTPLLLWPWHP
jgi:hypothetical protein